MKIKRFFNLMTLLSLSLAACAPALEQSQEEIAAEPPAAPLRWASSEALHELRQKGFHLNPPMRGKLRLLARKAGRPGNQLLPADLDLNGDGTVTRKEIQFVLSWQPEQLGAEGQYRLETQPELLPNRRVTGMVQIQVNNPEQVQDPGLLFDSRKLSQQSPLHLGQRDQQNFELFTYANYLPLRQKYAGKTGPDGQPLTLAWYAIVIHNPLENGPVTLTLAGSGNLNQANPAFASHMLSQLPLMDAKGREIAAERINHPTRSNDADLQYRMLHPEHHELKKAVTLSPGRSLILYTRLPLNNGLQDYRGEVQFQNQDPDLKAPLQVQAAVVTTLPRSPQNENGVLTDLDPNSFTAPLQAQLASFVEPRPGSSSNNLRQASDLSSPKALAAELSRRQLPNLRQYSQDYSHLCAYLGGLPTELPGWLAGKGPQLDLLKNAMKQANLTPKTLLAPFLSEAELSDYLTRGEALAHDLEQASSFDESLMRRIRGWNAEIKMVQRVLSTPDPVSETSVSPELKTVLSAMANPLWNMLFTLGRVNGVVRGSQIAATLPASDLVFQSTDHSREWNYVFNTNPFTTGGARAVHQPDSALSQSDAVGMLRQSANVSSPPALAYGNYGMSYRIEGRLRNESNAPQAYDIRIGSPDELGHLDWHSLFDQTDTLLGESSTRFTGTLRLTLAENDGPSHSQEFSLIHGRVQAPQSLLPSNAELAPKSELKVTVELVVPTNSTAPQLLQFKAGKGSHQLLQPELPAEASQASTPAG